jgi:molybdenum cofactor cytidylyltransferase
MGSPKALLKAPGSGPAESFLDRLIGLCGASCTPVIVVLGAHAEAIRAGAARRREATFVVNEQHHLGQLSSLQCGLRAVPKEAAGVLFTPVDYPGVQPGTIAGLVAALRRGGNVRVVIPRYQGKRGHPVAVTREIVAELLELPPGAQARDVIHRHAAEACYVDVDDPGILRDIDDPEAYRALTELP